MENLSLLLQPLKGRMNVMLENSYYKQQKQSAWLPSVRKDD